MSAAIIKESSKDIDRPHLRSLKKIADILLFSDSTQARRDAAESLLTLFARITGFEIDSEDPQDLNNTRLSDGNAIGPTLAASCILDHARTTAFLRGTRAAVIEAQHRFPGQIIHILYVGCGPFAPLVMPLTTQFSSEELRLTLLDISKRSINVARRTIGILGLDDFVEDYLECDATEYKHDGRHRYILS